MTNLVLILMKQTLKMTTRNFNEGLAQRCTVQPALRPSSIVSITGFVQGIVSSYQPDTGHRFLFLFKHLHSVLTVEVDVLSEDPLAVTSAGAVCVYSFVPSVRRQALNTAGRCKDRRPPNGKSLHGKALDVAPNLRD